MGATVSEEAPPGPPEAAVVSLTGDTGDGDAAVVSAWVVLTGEGETGDGDAASVSEDFVVSGVLSLSELFVGSRSELWVLEVVGLSGLRDSVVPEVELPLWPGPSAT